MESFKFWRKTLNFTIYTGEVLEQKLTLKTIFTPVEGLNIHHWK